MSEPTLEERLAGVVRNAVAEALEDVQVPGHRQRDAEAETWRARVHRVHEDTRLTLSEAAEALGVSERSVRRYCAGEGDYPTLPSRKGPTGITVQAGDLLTWLQDVEGANRFRISSGGAA